jgi:hypothetical protein
VSTLAIRFVSTLAFIQAVADNSLEEACMWPWLHRPMIPPRCLPSDLNLQGPVYGIEFREEVWQELGRLLEAYLGRVQPI